jgi:hypothetical protein
MNIEAAANAQFGDEDAFLDFLGQNEIAHQTIGAALARDGHIVSSPPPIGNPLETKDWLNDHWQRHRDECKPLGISVPDLSVADLKVEEQFSDWMILHSDLHSQENAALGIRS